MILQWTVFLYEELGYNRLARFVEKVSFKISIVQIHAGHQETKYTWGSDDSL